MVRRVISEASMREKNMFIKYKTPVMHSGVKYAAQICCVNIPLPLPNK